MTATRIVISEFMDEAALVAFGPEFAVEYDPGLVDDRERLLEQLHDCAALIVRNRTIVDATLLDAAPALRVVGRLGVGLDNIDMAECRRRNISVRPATGANTLSVAEYVIAAALSLVRGAYGANEAMLAGKWPRAALIGGELSGRVMGLVGFGTIARAVAERARAFGMAVAAHDPHVSPDDPAWRGVERLSATGVLEKADIISLHVPLTPATRNLIDANSIARMKPGAVVINTARGGVVDEPSLAAALRSGQLGGTALDVFSREPLDRASAATFAGISNLILTPHIAGVTNEANIRVSNVTVANVLEELARN